MSSHSETAIQSVPRKAVNGSKLSVVGLAYKPNVHDERESPSYVRMQRMKELGGGGRLFRSLRVGHPSVPQTFALGGRALGGLEPGNHREL